MHKVAFSRRAQSLCALAKFHTARGALCQKTALKNTTGDVLEMPPCSFTPEEHKGMSKESMMEICRKYCQPMTMKVTSYKKPVFVHQGHMQWLWDVDGRRYLDLFAGVATVSVGHCHPKVTAAAEKQLRKLWHTTNIYVYPSIHEYCEKLASHLPDPLKVVYLTNSGSEANDLAMLMARLHTGNFDIITLRGSYHGGGSQTIGLTSNSNYKFPVAIGLGSTNGVGGAVQYPKNYLKEAYKLVRERGGVCIADEVQTGFGRTGSHFWGFQGHDVIPDIVTMAKGIGNGFPMGAVVTTREIADCLSKGGVHFNTFGGNPVACSIASSVLDTIKEDGMQQNSLKVGTYLMVELAKLRDKYEVIGDVRGKGLQIGVEMVQDKASRAPLSTQDISHLFEDIKDMGVLVGKGGMYGQTFRIKPPMCITIEDANFFLSVFDKSILNYMERR
ncbi:alanine--glyoxylate aminotransferase 2, mitochondrial isoform X3 [Nerophis lumbriciformis]|uniref:alanine--glyoxylate aminotransferase 2, mitochondrial isoform X3 n=1 Tax=Nerophis lumbriciformis TaxID=546530 RepID=UPI002AE09752|nr:alanine--glyoxylate aminotransferase 2, mitochondrial isoform X3 [Nerophis lumbriciformis]